LFGTTGDQENEQARYLGGACASVTSFIEKPYFTHGIMTMQVIF
jgi:hypothetical protein